MFRTLKEESRLTRQMIEAIEKRSVEEARLTREAIAEGGRLTREMIERITEKLAQLIVSEGQKRQNV